MSKSSKIKDRQVVAKGDEDLKHSDVNSRSSVCSTSTKSFSADSLEISGMSPFSDRNIPLQVIEEELSSMYERKKKRCRTPKTLIALMQRTPDLQDEQQDDCIGKPASSQSYGWHSDTSDDRSGSGTRFEVNFDRKHRVNGKKRQLPGKGKNWEREASPIRKFPEDAHGVHFINPIEIANKREVAEKRLVKSKVNPAEKTSPPSKSPLKAGAKKTRNEVSADPETCPAAALLAQIENNKTRFQTNGSHKSKPVSENRKEPLKRIGSTQRESRRSENVTEVELFMPKLKLENGHFVFDCVKQPIIKKKAQSPMSKKPSSSKKMAAHTNEEEVVYPGVQATVTKINEVLSTTMRELKQKIDQILPNGKTSPTTKSSPNSLADSLCVNHSQHRSKPHKSQHADATNVSKPLLARERNQEKGTQRKTPMPFKVEISEHFHKPKQRLPLSPVVQPAAKVNPHRNKINTMTRKETNQPILERTFDVKKVKELLLTPPSCKYTTNTRRSCSWFLETRLPEHGKSYKEMYLENIMGKENTLKNLGEQDLLQAKPIECQNLALDSENKNNLKYCSKIKDESWIHSRVKWSLETPKAEESGRETSRTKRFVPSSRVSGKEAPSRREAKRKEPLHTLKTFGLH